MPDGYSRDRSLSAHHFKPWKNPLPQDFCLFLECLHSCGHPKLWNALSPELIGLDHESSCQSGTGISVLYYVKPHVPFISLLIFHRFLPSQTCASELKFLCISYDLELSLKVVLRSVEVENPVLWHLNSRETKELVIVIRERVGKWTRGHKPANSIKAFWKGWRYVWKGSYLKGEQRALTLC